MGHRDANEFLEVFGNELRPVVGDYPGPRWVKFLGVLKMISMSVSVIDSRRSQFTM